MSKETERINDAVSRCVQATHEQVVAANAGRAPAARERLVAFGGELRPSDYSGKRAAWKKYGLSIDDMLRLYSMQNGLCALCAETITLTRASGTRHVCIDHCHDTGIVRGLLCSECNTHIGRTGDSFDWHYRAARYLEMASMDVSYASRILTWRSFGS